MKILVATQKPFSPAAVKGIKEIIETAGHEFVLLEKYESNSQLLEAVADVDAIIIRSDKVNKEVMDAAKKLRIVVRAGAGVDNVDLAVATEKKIVVMNTPGQNSNAVAELVIAMMIYMARTQFTPSTGSEISGKKLGIQAYGNVGKLVAKKALALGMEVMAIDPFVPAEVMEKDGVKVAKNLDSLYSECNYVTLHIPATPETVNSINGNLVSKMPKGGCLINTARKEVVDEASLFKLMSERPDLKYITDVAPDNYEALKEKFGTAIFATSKKMGAQTSEANMNAGLAAARQIVDFFATGNTKFQVNK